MSVYTPPPASMTLAEYMEARRADAGHGADEGPRTRREIRVRATDAQFADLVDYCAKRGIEGDFGGPDEEGGEPWPM